MALTSPSPLWGGVAAKRPGGGVMSTNRARQLRSTMTLQGRRLWLRLKQLRGEGFHIRRQAPFRGYYLDFVSFARRVVIELDGAVHGEDAQICHDRTRDAVLKREGFKVLRFWNHQVHENISGVMETIRSVLAEASPTRPLRGHPPHKGEGEGLCDA